MIFYMNFTSKKFSWISNNVTHHEEYEICEITLELFAEPLILVMNNLIMKFRAHGIFKFFFHCISSIICYVRMKIRN